MKYNTRVTALVFAVWGCTEKAAPQVHQSQLGFEEVASKLGVAAGFVDDSAAQKRRATRLAALPPELAQVADTSGAMAAGDLEGDADVDLVVLTASGRAKVLLNPLEIGSAKASFIDESERAGLMLDSLAHSPILADLVGDEKPDLLVAGFAEGSLALYENRWPEGFVEVTAAMGLTSSLPSSGLAVADVDNDGDLDFFVSQWQVTPSEMDPETSALAAGSGAADAAGANRAQQPGVLWLNENREHFAQRGEALLPRVSASPSVPGLSRTLSPSFADIDADGDVDLLLAGETSVSVWVNSLRASDALKSETPEVPQAKAPELDAGAGVDAGVVVADSDEVNSPVPKPGTLQFVQAVLPRQVSGRGMALGDYDLDGDLDWFVSGGFGDAPNSAFLRNQGPVQQWTDVAPENGTRARGFGLSACVEDFDNDGLLDIFQVADATYAPGLDADGQVRSVNSATESRAALYLGRLDADGSFAAAASSFGLDEVKHGRGVLCFDYDKDGDVDLFVSAADTALQVFRNKLNPGVGTGANSLGLRLSFLKGNPSGNGARVTAVTHGVSQTREVRNAGGLFGSSASVIHFGFAAEEWIDELSVNWPNGESSTATDVVLSDILAIRYKGNE